jgi:hypothetical protein
MDHARRLHDPLGHVSFDCTMGVDASFPAFMGPRRSPKLDESGDGSTGRLVDRKQESSGVYG